MCDCEDRDPLDGRGEGFLGWNPIKRRDRDEDHDGPTASEKEARKDTASIILGAISNTTGYVAGALRPSEPTVTPSSSPLSDPLVIGAIALGAIGVGWAVTRKG